MSSDAAARVRAAVEPALSAAGFDLEDVVVRKAGSRRLVQVVVDRDGGVTLDAVADASRAVADVLDAGAAVTGPYVLEVTSPGVDRPLTAPRHWRRAIGRLVTARRADGREVTGRVRAAGAESATLDVSGAEVELSYTDVARAAVQVEFSRPGEPEPEPAADGDDDELSDDGELSDDEDGDDR